MSPNVSHFAGMWAIASGEMEGERDDDAAQRGPTGAWQNYKNYSDPVTVTSMQSKLGPLFEWIK